MEKNVRYFNFPVQLLRGFIDDTPEVLNRIFDYCLYDFAFRLDDAEIIDDEDGEGDYSDDEIILRKMGRAEKYFRLTIGDHSGCYRRGEKLYRSLPKNSPHCGLNVSIFWDFYEHYKKDFEKVTLLKFLAIKSILGKKPYCKITNDFIISRMDGHIRLSPKISPSLVKYGKEYQFRKIRNELQLNWHLKSYGKGVRGFYVSFDLDDEELIYIAEMNREKCKISKARIEQKATVEKVRERIKNELKISRPI